MIVKCIDLFISSVGISLASLYAVIVATGSNIITDRIPSSANIAIKKRLNLIHPDNVNF
jgi:hypothetical protein